MYIDLHVKLIFSTSFQKILKHQKPRENPSSGSPVVPCEREDGRTDRYDEAIAACRNFSNAPKDSTFCPHSEFICVLNGSQNKQRLFPYTALTD